MHEPRSINEGLRIVAGYIFGGNAGRKSLKMTAPVTQQLDPPAGEKIATGCGQLEVTRQGKSLAAEAPIHQSICSVL